MCFFLIWSLVACCVIFFLRGSLIVLMSVTIPPPFSRFLFFPRPPVAACWACCHCFEKSVNDLVSFLNNVSFIFITSSNPDVVHLKLSYSKWGRLSDSSVILYSGLIVLSEVGCLAGFELCVCHPTLVCVCVCVCVGCSLRATAVSEERSNDGRLKGGNATCVGSNLKKECNQHLLHCPIFSFPFLPFSTCSCPLAKRGAI